MNFKTQKEAVQTMSNWYPDPDNVQLVPSKGTPHSTMPHVTSRAGDDTEVTSRAMTAVTCIHVMTQICTLLMTA